jgi:hypothetical protein
MTDLVFFAVDGGHGFCGSGEQRNIDRTSRSHRSCHDELDEVSAI